MLGMPQRMLDRMSDGMPEIYQINCQTECQMECQRKNTYLCQKECQIECQNICNTVIMSKYASDRISVDGDHSTIFFSTPNIDRYTSGSSQLVSGL